MTDDVIVQVLVNNVADDAMVVEHGFSAWIDAGDTRILLDTGAGAALAPNAAHAGVDLSRANAVVLSHGHYDHTGGLPHVLSVNPTAELFVAPGVDRDRFSIRPGQEPRAIGMTAQGRSRMQALPASRRRDLYGPWMLAPGVGVTGPIPRTCPFEDTGGPFFLDVAGCVADPLEDDQALWLDTIDGLVIVVGCCHAGLVNTVNRVLSVTGRTRLRGLIGGFHLLNASDARIDKTLAALRGWGPDFVIPCHCTGDHAVDRVRSEMGDDTVHPGRAGLILSLGALRA